MTLDCQQSAPEASEGDFVDTVTLDLGMVFAWRFVLPGGSAMSGLISLPLLHVPISSSILTAKSDDLERSDFKDGGRNWAQRRRGDFATEIRAGISG